MAVFPPDGKPPRRRPSLRGVLMQDLVNGIERNRAWPTERKRRKTTEQKKREDDFRDAQTVAKYTPPAIQTQYREACEGTPLLPRDMLIATVYGTFVAIVTDTGKKYYSMANRTGVSDSLDVINQQPGSILFRGPQFWEALGPASPGQVLVMGPDSQPAWETISPGFTAAAANVNAQEGTGSTGYTNLATVGPEVTVITGTEAIVAISAVTDRTTGGFGNNSYIAFEVTGATTIAAADANGTTLSAYEPGFAMPFGRTLLISGLTPGANTFRMKYRVNGNNFDFANRSIAVWAL